MGGLAGMKKWTRRNCIALLSGAVFLFQLMTPHARAESEPQNLGLFILGKPGTHGFDGLFDSAHQSLSRVLAMNGFDEETAQMVFNENPSIGKNHYSCDRASLEKNISAAAKRGSYDSVVLFIAGHANGRDEDAFFHLPGQDIRYQELIDLIQQIHAKHWIVVVAAAQGQVWVKEFSGKNRIVIAGNGQREFDFMPVQFLTLFPRMFEQASLWHVQNAAAEAAPKPISLAEVFFLTARAVHRWYADNNLLATEEPVLEADGDGTAVSVWPEKTKEGLREPDVLKASPVWVKEAVPANKILFSMSAAGGN